MKKLLCLLFLWPSTATATKLGVKEHPCPLGEGTVKVYSKIAANTHGGFDSDLATYASNGQFREYAISTCPQSLLSLFGRDMLATWSTEELAAMSQVLDNWRPTQSKEWGDQTTDRYLLAAEIYKALGRDAFFLANLYVEASWVARDQVVGVFLGLEGPGAAIHMLNEGETALQKDMDSQQRKILLHNLSRIAHRAGLVEERNRYLDAFAQLDLNDKEQSVLSEMRQGIELESQMQALAIEQLTTGLRIEGLDMTQKVQSTYLLADLLRRNMEYRKSFGLFAFIIAEEAAPESLRKMALLLSNDMTQRWPHLFESPGP